MSASALNCVPVFSIAADIGAGLSAARAWGADTMAASDRLHAVASKSRDAPSADGVARNVERWAGFFIWIVR